MNEQIDIIIARKLSGEATAGELRELDDWLSADSSNREAYDRAAAFWQQADQLLGNTAFDTTAAWEKVAARTGDRKTINARKIALPAWSKYLAAAAALLLLGLFFFSPGNSNELQTITATDANTEVILPDQSRITLRQGSTISYPETFAAGERRVKLEGEAFFDVTRDEHKPFIIDARQVKVRVLGTSFTVKCDDATAQVTVSTGKVQMISCKDTASYLVLTPGEQGNLEAQQLVEKNVEDSNYLFWKTGRLQYDHKPLRAIVADLAMNYHQQIILSPALSPAIQEQLVSISFNKQTIETVLNELCLVARCSWQQKNGQYVIAESRK